MGGPFTAKLVALGAASSVALSSHAAFAQGWTAPTHTTTYHSATVVDPESLEAYGQYYDASVGGLRDYLDTQRQRDQALFAQLDPKLASLESRQTAGYVVMFGSLGAGIAMFAIDLSDDDTGVGPLTYASIGVIAIGPLLGWALLPGRSDVMEFVNLHNRLAPTPLAWEGQTPRTPPARRAPQPREDADLAGGSVPGRSWASADGRTTLSTQSSGVHRLEIASVGPKQQKELRVSRLDPPLSFHECKELVLVVDGTPHVGVARHRGQAHQGHLLENLDMALGDELVGALRAASRATLQICGTQLELETAMRERLPESTTAQATAQLMPPLTPASTPPRMSVLLQGVTLVITGTAAPADSVTLTLAAQAPRDAGSPACEVKLLADGKVIALPALARTAGAYGDEYRASVPLSVVEQLSAASRIVGKVCDQRFQLSAAHLTELRELVIKLREERELSGP